MSDPVRGAAEDAATDARERAIEAAMGALVMLREGGETPRRRRIAAAVVDVVLAAVGGDTPAYEQIPGWRYNSQGRSERVHPEDDGCDDVCESVFRVSSSPHGQDT